MLVDMDDIKAGQSFHCKERRVVEKLKEFEARGIALQRDVYDLGNERVNKILTILALYADEYRTEVLGLDNFFVAAPLRGCAACAKTETPEGLELRGCRECVNESIALFCSKVRASWNLQPLCIVTFSKACSQVNLMVRSHSARHAHRLTKRRPDCRELNDLVPLSKLLMFSRNLTV